MIEIDGGEGGGAVVRVAVGLSAATRQPVRIKNIRGQRPNPGLQPQHIAGVEAVADLVDAEHVGVEHNATTLTFVPNSFHTPEQIRVNISTAGSVGLALQPLQIALLDTDKSIDVTVDGGATAGKWAPPVEYIKNVTVPVLQEHGFNQSIDVKRHGFYPKGGALVHATFDTGELQPLNLTGRGEITAIHGVSMASQHLESAEVAERQRKEARRVIANKYPSMELDIEQKYIETQSPGSVLVLWAVTENGNIIGADAIGEKGKRSEEVGKEAAKNLLSQLDSGAPVDEWLADQLIPVLALATGTLRVPKFTDHVDHNIRVAKQFVDREWTIQKEKGLVEVK